MYRGYCVLNLKSFSLSILKAVHDKDEYEGGVRCRGKPLGFHTLSYRPVLAGRKNLCQHWIVELKSIVHQQTCAYSTLYFCDLTNAVNSSGQANGFLFSTVYIFAMAPLPSVDELSDPEHRLLI